ncbi:putative endonuclease [Pseudomonas phage Ep4]|uniref:Endonuclease n=1 Tax=Pseudomonas phage Ep4 TaxID=3057492 RepID=A0AAU9EEB8_9CAUD|nr:putative endonuclease [Pseudomonas phage Ep4]
MPTRKLARSQIRPLALRLYAQQGSVCPLCGRPIDLAEKAGLVLDHDHVTGRVRGALHRSCNAAEGKVANAAGRWGAKSMDYAAIVPWLKNLLAYLEQAPTDFIYPSHLTEDEKKAAALAKARRSRATRQARQVVRKSVIKKES